MKQSLFRTLIVAFALALFLEIVLQPTAPLGAFASFALILILEVVGIAASVLMGGGFSGTVTRILFVSAVLAFIFVYIMAPAVAFNFDSPFIAVFIIEVSGTVLAWYFSRERKY